MNGECDQVLACLLLKFGQPTIMHVYDWMMNLWSASLVHSADGVLVSADLHFGGHFIHSQPNLKQQK
jgi:hypothetical protein